MWTFNFETIESGHVVGYKVLKNGNPCSCSEVLAGWINDSTFRNFYNDVLAGCEFAGFRWETPVWRSDTLDRAHEFVLVNAASFVTRRTDSRTYREYFDAADPQAGAICFPTLGRDATLIVPTPRSDQDIYGYLAPFVRSASESQRHQLWQLVGETVLQMIGDRPLWLNTAGGGVAWLHVRIDTRPKYYHYTPYTRNHSLGSGLADR